MSSGRKKAFILRDFSAQSIEVALESLQEVGADGWDVQVSGIGGNSPSSKVFDSVRRDIEAADKIIALCDRLNANVGYEIGFALGIGKPVVLALTEWDHEEKLRSRAPFMGLWFEHARGLKDLQRCVQTGSELRLEAEPIPGKRTLLVCPAGGEGDVFAHLLEELRLGWSLHRDEQWQLNALPSLLAGVGRLVWTIAPVQGRKKGMRDGQDNMACAVVAGYAHAREIRPRVLFSPGTREVVDVAPAGRSFRNLAELREELLRIDRIDRRDRRASPSSPRTVLVPAQRPVRSLAPRVRPVEVDQPSAVLDEPRPVSAQGAEAPGGPSRSRIPVRPYLLASGVLVGFLAMLLRLLGFLGGGDGRAGEPQGFRLPPRIPGVAPVLVEGFTYLGDQEQGLAEYALDRDPTLIFVLLPEGSFWMGASTVFGDKHNEARATRREEPPHLVQIDAFLISKYELTNQQFARFLDSQPSFHRPEFWTDPKFDHARQPVVGISWGDAGSYCIWAGLELPSEAQWEYACRAGTRSDWSTPRALTTDDANVRRSDNEGGHGRPLQVGSFPPNPWGLFDMHGNVWELCADDWSADYRESASAHPHPYRAREVTRDRVVRGGSFEEGPMEARSAFRSPWRLDLRYKNIGFRPVKNLRAQ